MLINSSQALSVGLAFVVGFIVGGFFQYINNVKKAIDNDLNEITNNESKTIFSEALDSFATKTANGIFNEMDKGVD
jgi:hypothetical protein